MRLNSSSVMPLLASSYSDEVLYFSNSNTQAPCPTGGRTPVTGRHSTIDSPESVSRVAPPTITMSTSRAAIALSHSRIARRCALAASVVGATCTSPRISFRCLVIGKIQREADACFDEIEQQWCNKRRQDSLSPLGRGLG